ncbi:fumarylacetoacetate hydrolase family protein [Parapusillimonas granuli]|uniref:Fumarylacetoacetate hydrolase family protein n=1 Tax=Parapusillimonas granuli TaxID=380911 RepID=A0A853G3D4_9BURK|nr:fumarylacetoacetate hydrolase family protein [Parapusillimonas granuli]MBB5215883.1 5-oxopent-3-ene-1,2,5-tricarboxylate decarboxylase/2-hydroxyhepta-2,4-diene-1,7-dioate isomerase [Parapusillimonas granuli]MEB2399426.1 fumarylacetoacetate hydrolase family protein [Alcaligenaceae bacterium]NYT50819.1 fumarylacetoacetate hydrolase family protein [Parapusillimonas granuli]
MKHARILHNGAVCHATQAADGRLQLSDGTLLEEHEAVWLPPVEPRTTFTLAINYADHAKELAFRPPPEPLGFLKAANTFVGHRGITFRPDDVAFMHYECELAVVIGKTGRNIPREQAYDHVAGYTVANDYALRDYLENWYRPNLRVKSRDTCTPLGPWLVDRDDIPDPMNLDLRTTVNGVQTQSGNTRDMVFDIAALIEYFSGFMTLSPGDVILTGTPDGVVNVQVGDEVVTEIAGVGRLVNTIAALPR